jgi:predicted enzyme related to lactoylglutathione lyase
MAGTRFDLVTIDTDEPRRLARFWCTVLELVVLDDEDDGRWLVLGGSDGRRRIGLQRVNAPGPVIGRTHLDLVCDTGDFDREIHRLTELGAVLLSPVRGEPYGSIANLADPDGNRFDLCSYA